MEKTPLPAQECLKRCSLELTEELARRTGSKIEAVKRWVKGAQVPLKFTWLMTLFILREHGFNVQELEHMPPELITLGEILSREKNAECVSKKAQAILGVNPGYIMRIFRYPAAFFTKGHKSLIELAKQKAAPKRSQEIGSAETTTSVQPLPKQGGAQECDALKRVIEQSFLHTVGLVGVLAESLLSEAWSDAERDALRDHSSKNGCSLFKASDLLRALLSKTARQNLQNNQQQ